MTRLICLLIFINSIVFSTLAFSQSAPEDLIKDIFERAGKDNLLENSASKDIVESHVDFAVMSKDILGSELKKRNSEELKWFEETIKEIITKSVYPSAPKFLENVKISFKRTQSSEEVAQVSSTVTKKGEGTQVDYVLKKINNEWKIVDVAIDDESWVKTINEKVQKTLKEKGWKGLKDLLSKRLSDLKNPKKAALK